MLYTKSPEFTQNNPKTERSFKKLKIAFTLLFLITTFKVADAITWKTNAMWKDMKVIEWKSDPIYNLPGIFGNVYTFRVTTNRNSSELVRLYPWYLIGVTNSYNDSKFSKISHTIEQSRDGQHILTCQTASTFFEPVEVIGDCILKAQ